MIDDATKEVVYRDYIDISVAVATPRVCWSKKWGALVFDSYPFEEADLLRDFFLYFDFSRSELFEE